MSAATEALSDQLAAEIELIEERLDTVRDRLASATADVRERLMARADAIWEQAERFHNSTSEWLTDPYLRSTVTDDLAHAVDALSADVDAATEPHGPGLRATVDRQLRTWRARLERLRVQEKLAEMEIRDDLAVVSDRLRAARDRAVIDLRHAGEGAKEKAEDFLDDLEDLLEDAGEAVERAVKELTDD